VRCEEESPPEPRWPQRHAHGTHGMAGTQARSRAPGHPHPVLMRALQRVDELLAHRPGRPLVGILGIVRLRADDGSTHWQHTLVGRGRGSPMWQAASSSTCRRACGRARRGACLQLAKGVAQLLADQLSRLLHGGGCCGGGLLLARHRAQGHGAAAAAAQDLRARGRRCGGRRCCARWGGRSLQQHVCCSLVGAGSAGGD